MHSLEVSSKICVIYRGNFNLLNFYTISMYVFVGFFLAAWFLPIVLWELALSYPCCGPVNLKVVSHLISVSAFYPGCVLS